MFGVDPTETRPCFRVCCGPRCGAESGHRGIYAVAERAAGNRPEAVVVQPSMCQGFCGRGVTLALPNGAYVKLRDACEARAQIEQWKNEREPLCPL